MPAVSPKRKKLPPLDEESCPKMEHPLKNNPAVSLLKEKEVYDILYPLSVAILSRNGGSDAETPLNGSTLEVASNLLKKGLPLCIEVLGQSRNEPKSPPEVPLNERSVKSKFENEMETVLIEKWVLLFRPTTDSDCPGSVTSGPFLCQAVHSFLHFSQIKSWSVSNGGHLPFDLIHRAYSSDSSASFSFLFHPPETHVFPVVPIPSVPGYIHVSVTHLPRLDDIPSLLLSTPTSTRTELENQLSIIQNEGILTDFSCQPKCTETMESKSWTPTRVPTNFVSVSQQAPSLSWNGSLLADHEFSIPQPQVHQQFCNKVKGSSGTLLSPNKLCDNGGFPFSPPNPSPLSHKVLPLIPAGSDGLQHYSFPACASTQTNRMSPVEGKDGNQIQSCIDQLESISLSANCTSDCESDGTSNGITNTSIRTNSSTSLDTPFVSASTSSRSSRVVFSRLSEASSSPSMGNGISSTSNFVSKTGDPFTAGQKGKVRHPGASSPIPFLLRRSTFDGSDADGKESRKKLKRRSYGGLYTKNSTSHVPPTRSMSLPAVVPNLCLLGTFEESVLNGRIDPLGFVEGFTAELGASGSFCPQHITLPVTASFFSLSEDGGPSPYLGHIDLSSIKKRGYHIPRKGTVQLTLFNPTRTIVKIFVVTYDNTDMPPNTGTFIRQKTLSRPSHSTTDTAVCSLPSLQYLIHLRFLCSKSSRTYLHTDIKLLFAQRAPDTDPDLSKDFLYTLHEGPSNPKYGPLNNEYL